MEHRKKLIEVALPLDAINEASAREKSIRHGHPSTLHLWWARRPLAAARAVIFAQMVDDPSEYVDVLLSDPKRKRAAMRALKKRGAEHAASPSGFAESGDGEASASAEPANPASHAEPGEPSERQALRDMAAELERERLFGIIEELVLWRTPPTRRCWTGREPRSGRAGGGPAPRTRTIHAPRSCSTDTDFPHSMIPSPAVAPCPSKPNDSAWRRTPATSTRSPC